MMNTVRSRHTFSNRGLLYPARPHIPTNSVIKPIPTDGDPAVKKRIFRSISPTDRTTNDWTTIAWPTNIQSKTPDGQFGPATQIQDWGDCWFLATLAAVANDRNGQQMLADSIKKITVEGISGYAVTFQGSPDHTIFISEQRLAHFVDENGGDADTRLLELAADRFFSVTGRFQSLYLGAMFNVGMDQNMAEDCLDLFCQSNGVQNPKSYNPIRRGAYSSTAFFMLTGRYPDMLLTRKSTALQPSYVQAFLNQYVVNNRDGVSVVITTDYNPLGETNDARDLVHGWDMMRTVITRDGRLSPQQRAFLNALDQWLTIRDEKNLATLRSAAKNLKLSDIDPEKFVNLLTINQSHMNQNHFNVLRSGVREVLAGGPGFIGFSGEHCGTLEGIDPAAGTFTYTEPNSPTLVLIGDMSHLIQSVTSGIVWLTALRPTAGQDAAESSHAGEKRGRHLLAYYNQAVKDGTIDPAESSPLANLMAMDGSGFRKIYDSDHNGVIEDGELKAVQLRVERWADHLTLTPIW